MYLSNILCLPKVWLRVSREHCLGLPGCIVNQDNPRAALLPSNHLTSCDDLVSRLELASGYQSARITGFKLNGAGRRLEL